MIVVRVLVHHHFSGVFVDGDQTINWLSAVDKANGLWYTPYFYGQFYNVSIEAICAAPWIAIGFPVEQVMPIVSNIIGMLPFLFGALFLAKKERYNTGLILLCLGIILPAQYHFVTAMARGFAGGIAVLSVGIFLIGYKNRIVSSLGFGLTLFSYFVNPNVVILLMPLGLLWLIEAWQSRDRHNVVHYVPIVVGLVIAAIGYAWLNAGQHPLYEVHRLWDIAIDKKFWFESLQSLDARFLYLFPFLPKMGSLVLVVLLVQIGILVARKERNGMIVMTSFVAFLLTTLAVNKTMDGTYSTFFPYSRMFLALPFAMVIGCYFIVRGKFVKNRFYIILGIVAVAGFVYQIIDIPKKAIASVQGNTGVVQVLTIEKLCVECEKMKTIQQQYQADIMVFHYKTDEYIYGCKALQPSMTTLYPEYERRYWTFEKHAYTPYPTILFMDWSLQLPDKLKTHIGQFEAIENIHYPAYLLTNNTQSLVDLYSDNKLALRPHK